MTTQSSPGGYLVKDFADGWYWTPNAASAHEGGAAVWSIEDNRYETVPPALAIPPAATEDAHRTMDGETVWGFKVAAWRYVGPQDPDDARFGHRYCEHWSTVGNAPKKVERLFTEDQLRAALSAAPAPEGGAVEKRMIDAGVSALSARYPILKTPIDRDDIEAVLTAALATREEAPAEARELAEAMERLGSAADFLEGDCVIVGDHEVRGNDLLAVLSALRAQPPAREDAQPVADAVEPIERAVAALKVHIEAIQVAKADGGSSSVITDCVNGLPEIVRWIESGVFNVEAAFEQHEDTHPAPDALRVAVEALEKIKARAADDGTGSSVFPEIRNIASKTLAALQAEQKGGA